MLHKLEVRKMVRIVRVPQEKLHKQIFVLGQAAMGLLLAS